MNHAPTDLVLANGCVVENSPKGTLVGNFGTADPDPGERFTYSIAGRFAGMFRVDGDRLLTNGDFDFEKRDSYSILVLALDSRGASISRQVTIQVMDQLEGQLDPDGLQLITRPHHDIPPSDSVANGFWSNVSGIAGSEIVFSSAAPNLILGDTNGRTDVFVASQGGKKERISVSQNGQEANGDSVGAKISRNGRLVAFISSATNLVAGDTNERSDAFVRDRLLGTTQRISLRNDRSQFSEGGVTEVAISANGRFVAFVETYSGFQQNEGGLYVRDLLLGTTKRLIATPDGEPYPGSISISGDGQRIAYSLYEQSAIQVHVIDRLTGAIRLVSVSRSGTVRPENSSGCAISANGRFVVFESEAVGLVEGGETMQGGIFIRDLSKNTTQRIDFANDGSAPNGSADSASISADGRFVAFRSLASNLSPPDSPLNGPGYFVRDLRTGQTQPVVVTLDGNRTADDGPERIAPMVSNDGRNVAFQHFASNLVPRDGNNAPDLFLRDTRANTTELLTRRHETLPSATSFSYYGSVSSAPSLTTDGSTVFFASPSTTLTPDLVGSSPFQFDPKLFIRDLKSPGDIAHLSFTTYSTFVSRNGRFALFWTYDSLVPEDSQYGLDWYVLDRETGTYRRANLGSDGSRLESFVVSPNALNDDGRYVVFQSSSSNVVAGDTNGRRDIFVRDLLLGTTTRVSIASDGNEANADCDDASLSLDGRFVVFASAADNLVPDDHNRTSDVFVRDRLLGTTERVSVNSDGLEGDNYSFSPLISGDGRCVAFRSYSTNLVSGSLSSDQVYWHDRLTGATQLVSVTHGLPGSAALSSISNDGRFVVFESGDSNFVPGDTNRSSDVFVRDMLRAVTIRASVGPNGRQANDNSSNGIISGDGTKLAFLTSAANLIPYDFNGAIDVVLVDLATIPAVPSYSVRAGQIQTPEESRTPLTFVFERDGSADRRTTISFRASGSAKAFKDYQISGTDTFDGVTGTVTFAVGQNQVVVRLTPVADKLVEVTENVTVTLADDVLAFPSETQASVSILDDDHAGFTVTPSRYAGTVNETGSSLKVFVVLDAQPSANVILNVVNGDTTEIRVSAKTLTFTPANWNVPQSVTIRGIDDFQADGDQQALVAFQISSLTSDELFKSTNWLDLTAVDILDNGIGHRR